MTKIKDILKYRCPYCCGRKNKFEDSCRWEDCEKAADLDAAVRKAQEVVKADADAAARAADKLVRLVGIESGDLVSYTSVASHGKGLATLVAGVQAECREAAADLERSCAEYVRAVIARKAFDGITV